MGHDGLSRIRKHSSRKQSASSSCDDFDIEYDGSRVRSLSVCSDDSNFIEFGTPPTPDLSKVDHNAKPKQINRNEATNKPVNNHTWQQILIARIEIHVFRYSVLIYVIHTYIYMMVL